MLFFTTFVWFIHIALLITTNAANITNFTDLSTLSHHRLINITTVNVPINASVNVSSPLESVTITMNGSSSGTMLVSRPTKSSSSSITTNISNGLFIQASTVTCPNGADQVQVDVTMGWIGSQNSAQVNSIISLVQGLESDFTNSANGLASIRQNGELVCGAFAGLMVSNPGFASTLLSDAISNLQSQGIPNTKYWEGTAESGEPMKGFGLVCDTTGNLAKVQATLRGWSQGDTFSGQTGSVTSTDTICYVAYASRKTGDGEGSSIFGPCNTGTISSGGTASSACNNLAGEDLTAYNPSLDLSALLAGEHICCSIGTNPDVCGANGATFYQNIVVGWWGTDNVQNSVVNQLVENVQTNFVTGENQRTFSYQSSDGVICAAWYGAKFDNVGMANVFTQNALNYIKSNGIANTRYFEYNDASGDPTLSLGLVCDTTNNENAVQTAVKRWSQGDPSDIGQGTLTWSSQPLCVLGAPHTGNYQATEIGTCLYERVASGQTPEQTCSNLPAYDVEEFNPNANYSDLSVNQPLCCSAGVMPNFMPQPHSDGSCYNYTVQSGDSCASIMAEYWPLTEDDLMEYNKNTFNWLGCTNGHPWVGDNICLSEGTPPRPTVNPEAECGPQAPGDLYNTSCPLDTCCSMYGFCGYTSAYCDVTSSLTGAPGTTGCLSNCGYGSLSDTNNGSDKTIAYWIDDGTLDALDIDGVYDTIVYAFMSVNSDLSLNTSSVLNSDFMYLSTSKKVVSIGGWDFSTDPSTYQVFRDMVQSSNIDAVSTSISAFINDNDLDGIDLDWEYPGEPDIPGIPADPVSDATQYYQLIKAIKSKLNDGKTLSLTIPASYWYLRPYPLHDIDPYVDYYEIMTYDLHGQWDYSNQWDGGNHVSCHTNMTETLEVLRLVSKAGLDVGKIYVGIASYARSFEVSTSGCYEIGCTFTGPSSGATPGEYTDVPGILSFDDISYIQANDQVNDIYNDTESQCTIMLYNNNQWAAWSSDNNQRAQEFAEYGFAGTSLWVSNYEAYTGGFNSSADTYAEETDYLGYVVYTDLFNCSGIDITEQSQFSSVDPLCLMYAWSTYLINLGSNVANNIENLMNSDTYQENFIAYKDYLNETLRVNYTTWLINHPQYFACDGTCTCDIPGSAVCGVGNTEPCASLPTNTVNGPMVIVPTGGGSPPPNCARLSLEIDNWHIINSTDAFDSLSDALNMTITMNNIVTYADTSFEYIDETAAFANLVNTDGFNIDNLVIDPLTAMTPQNISDIRSLISTARGNLSNTFPSTVLNSLIPITLFATVSDTATNINIIGGDIRAQEYKEREEMIVDIIFGIFGVALGFLSPVESAISEAILASLQTLVDFEISGSLDPSDLVNLGFGIFSDSLGFIRDIGSIERASDDIAGILTDSNTFDKLQSSIYFTKLTKDVYKQCA